MKLDRLHEISVFLDQRPGELAGLLDLLHARGVGLVGLSVSEHNGRGLVRVVGEPLETVRQVAESLIESGIGPVVESEVLAVELAADRPAAMRDLTTALADHGINVRYAYLIPVQGPGVPRLVFRVDDLETVQKTIDEIDWPNGPAAASGAGPV